MNITVIITDEQKRGFDAQMLQENARRMKPVVINGRPARLPQLIDAQSYAQAIVNDICAAGNAMLNEAEDAELLEKIKAMTPEERAEKGLA